MIPHTGTVPDSAAAPHQRAPFGTQASETMIVARYRGGRWEPPRIVAFADVRLSPLARALHYGQSVFEGFKASRHEDGSVSLFRAGDHIARLNRSAERLCIPPVDEAVLLRSVHELVAGELTCVPDPPGFLYVRPLIFADEAGLLPGVAGSFQLLVMLCPVQPLFDVARGARLCTRPEFVRAAPGGTGSAKCAGNYAAALQARQQILADGFDEVLWLDARERRWVEETGSMNVMMVRDGQLITPPLSDTILPGITRDSLLKIASRMGIECSEERVSIDADDWLGISEVFSAGTAAGTAHVSEVVHDGRVLFERTRPGPVAQRLGAALADLIFGRAPDPFGWRGRCQS